MKDLKITQRGDALLLPVRVQARASVTQIAGVHDGAIKIRLTAPPLENRANRELLKFLAEILHVPPGRLELIAGEHSRQKTVAVKGLSREELTTTLAQYLV